MCRSIKQLRRPEGPPTDAELQAAALQFVRKVSGFRAPSKVNSVAFEQAVNEIANTTRLLLNTLVVPVSHVPKPNPSPEGQPDQAAEVTS